MSKSERLIAKQGDLLSLMSVFDRQGIPKSIVDDAFTSETEFQTALGTLKAYSLITENEAAETYGMHRLVQLSTRE